MAVFRSPEHVKFAHGTHDHQRRVLRVRGDFSAVVDAQSFVKAVAAVGMDIESDLVKRRTATILQVALTALGASLLTALAVAIILANRVSKPLYELRRTVEAIGKGDLAARTNLNSKDEFGKVGEAINSMAEGLQERRALLSSIERYVPYKVVDSILHSPESPTLKGERIAEEFQALVEEYVARTYGRDAQETSA